MLPASSSFERRAINRVTFGARDTDVAYAQQIGWYAWVQEQLTAPPGDDAQVAAHLASQTMQITYAAAQNDYGGWPAVDELRPLTTMTADIASLWAMQVNAGRTVSYTEISRVQQELGATTWIRNTHSRNQIREFMTDFWHNHFNIGKDDDQFGTIALPVYDRDAIRPYVLGNFRQMLEANATSTSMLVYLDNFVSNAVTPNENYARELMELHTLGAGAYVGKTPTTPAVLSPANGTVAATFSDYDVVQASRALSGWSIENGQRINGVTLPRTGKFSYNSSQHNAAAGLFMGVDLSLVFGVMAQGRRVLDIIATHPATADFICTKLCRRIFGDAPPATVLARAKATWSANLNSSDQIRRVLEAILLEGAEVGSVSPTKIRRPYERLLALFRTTDTVVNAGRGYTTTFDALRDGLYAWSAPNGRPDVNGYWLSTGANLATWNILLQQLASRDVVTTLANQTPVATGLSATAVVEYWVGRMVGFALQPAAMSALIVDQGGSSGVPAALRTNRATTIETAYRRLAGLIATTEEFTLR